VLLLLSVLYHHEIQCYNDQRGQQRAIGLAVIDELVAVMSFSMGWVVVVSAFNCHCHFYYFKYEYTTAAVAVIYSKTDRSRGTARIVGIELVA
jgi:hypothetical protein